MVIPQATVEGFEPRPPPADWTEGKPQDMLPPAQPVVNRMLRPYSASATTPGAGTAAPVTLQAPPRTLGSKIPINRRHKRRR